MRRAKGRPMPQTQRHRHIASLQPGVITRIEDFGLGYVKADTGQYYTFQFDKIEDYGGEAPREMGLQAGSRVLFASEGPKLVLLRRD